MATASYAPTADDWTDAGTTPCYVQVLNTACVAFVIDTSAPASSVPATAGHQLGVTGETSADIGLAGQRLYLRSLSLPANLVPDVRVSR
ncbi:hypothetical protein OPKNFCMD_3820 [Methylobacterium crusticola]|uniref:Uncharacterized protein n=1 Tax=Methylobacterium crusticola TaxID=1697972 RepID=A0ABQ4R1P6_9HYPH|nr:hypothetical protein [Methylobacterium crusticola]GJD51069.1 hypothetical protein OPKNFCMD_3820 [Methylobacterium crusticola]